MNLGLSKAKFSESDCLKRNFSIIGVSKFGLGDAIVKRWNYWCHGLYQS